jgi:ABC-type Fe3+ transport system substrate-binding protein
MNKKYGTNLQPQFTPGGPFDQMISKITQEAAANQPASSDVYLGSSSHIGLGTKAGVLKKVDWQSVLDRPLAADVKLDRIAPEGTGVATGTRVVGITYNSQLVTGDDVPKSLDDPLKPKWKGKIASTPYATGFYDFAAPDGLGYDFMKDYTSKIGAQAGGLIRCGDTNRILSGEFVMLVFDCGGNDVIKLREERNAPIGHARLKEVGRLNIIYLAVPNNSSAPNAAQLFTAFMHTTEGQALYWKYDRIDLHGYQESKTYPMVKEITGKLIVSTVQREASLATSGFDVQKTSEEFAKILTEAVPQ